MSSLVKIGFPIRRAMLRTSRVQPRCLVEIFSRGLTFLNFSRTSSGGRDVSQRGLTSTGNAGGLFAYLVKRLCAIQFAHGAASVASLWRDKSMRRVGTAEGRREFKRREANHNAGREVNSNA